MTEEFFSKEKRSKEERDRCMLRVAKSCDTKKVTDVRFEEQLVLAASCGRGGGSRLKVLSD